ncbi:MAG: UrcA family protein [Rhizomicrobium sp.]
MFRSFRFALMAGAVALAAAVPAAAQDYGRHDRDGRYDNAAYGPDDTERVIVISPRGERWVDRNGVEKLSREVSYADLDLGTREGAHAFRERIRATARDVCHELTNHDSAADQGYEACYTAAARDALNEADDVIADARD